MNKGRARESLKGLKLELDRHDFTEKQLNTAWNEMTNQDIVADIIAFIRQQALGSALISHETRVRNAVAKLKQNHSFNKMQLEWLARIEKVMLEESVLDERIFEIGAFKNNGGFNGIDRRFGGKLRELHIFQLAVRLLVFHHTAHRNHILVHPLRDGLRHNRGSIARQQQASQPYLQLCVQQ